MHLITWFAKNPIAANVLMLLILGSGLASLWVIKKQVRPPVALDKITITASYPGAAPSGVEQTLCIPIEEATRGLEDIKTITSKARQGHCQVVVEVAPGADTGRLLAAIKQRVDNIETWPKEAEEPIYQVRYGQRLAAIVSIHGPAGRLVLSQWTRKVAAGLLALPEVSEAQFYAVPDYEMAIEVAPDQLWRYGLSLGDIAEAVAQASLNLPGGEIETLAGEILLRYPGQACTEKDFKSIVLRAGEKGARLTLGEVATVRYGLVEEEVRAFLDGEPSMALDVFPRENTPATVEAIHDYVAKMRPRLPKGVHLTVWDEKDRDFSRLTDMLQGSALMGFCLVVTVLGLFLGVQLAFWASLGILVSFSGALALMPWFGLSLNTYTIYAFILALGMVVDDAIVISENVYTHQERGRDGLAGALSGTQELAPLVILMVLITVVAFLPGWLLPGTAGRVIANFAIVVILTLLFSPIDALLILPAHLAHHRVEKQRSNGNKLNQVPVVVGRGLDWLIIKIYRPLLAALLRWRYSALAGFIAALAVALSLVTAGYLPVVLKPTVPGTFVLAHASMPAAMPFQGVIAFRKRMKRAFEAVRAAVDAKRPPPPGAPSAFRHVNTTIFGSDIYIYLSLRADAEAVREALPHILKDRWRSRLEPLPKGVHLSFWFGGSSLLANQLLSTPPRPIELVVSATDLETLRAGTQALTQALKTWPGLTNVSNSYQPGKPELRYHLTDKGRRLGLTPQDLARQVRDAFYGREVQRFYRGQNEVKVMVRYPERFRRELSSLYHLPVALPNGQLVAFSTVAEWSFMPGASVIVRQNRRRVLHVGADVAGGNAALAQNILQNLDRRLFPQLEKRFPGLTIEVGETRQEQRTALSTLTRYAGLALLAIYALLAIALGSYGQPLLVMAVIPFSFIGVVGGHLLTGVNLTLYSMVALLAAAGVVVKDSLVLVDWINRDAKAPGPLLPALLQAGQARFRPILLTTLTTFLGLMPTLWAEGAEAERLIPMEVTLACGVLFSAFVILVLVFYLITDDLQRGVKDLRRWGRNESQQLDELQ